MPLPILTLGNPTMPTLAEPDLSLLNERQLDEIGMDSVEQAESYSERTAFVLRAQHVNGVEDTFDRRNDFQTQVKTFLNTAERSVLSRVRVSNREKLVRDVYTACCEDYKDREHDYETARDFPDVLLLAYGLFAEKGVDMHNLPVWGVVSGQGNVDIDLEKMKEIAVAMVAFLAPGEDAKAMRASLKMPEASWVAGDAMDVLFRKLFLKES